jgi:DNA-binding CsgD family transcriptional regulator
MDVSMGDISRVYRLVQETTERWDDPRVWREYLLNGACALLGGRMATMLANCGGAPGYFGRFAPVGVVGALEAQREELKRTTAQWQNRSLAEAADANPGFNLLRERMQRQRWATVSRAEMAREGVHPPEDADDFLISVRHVDLPRRVEIVNVFRPHIGEPFSDREVALLKLLHDEVAPLVGVRLATEDQFCREGLSTRLRETLTHLLHGKSEKEAAAAMGIGSRTVHDYVTTLYEHFQVSSRSELLAYFVRREPVYRGSGHD